MPNPETKHLQLVITNGIKFHQSLSVYIKNSDVLVQPIDTSPIHITLHPNEGKEKRKNCHLRIESSEVKKFCTKKNGATLGNKGMLVEWNRDVSPHYNCPLELRFPSNLASNISAQALKAENTQIIDYGKGTLHVNFWFTSLNKEELINYFNSSGVTMLMFEKIDKTGENFVLTYNIVESCSSYENMEKDNSYFELVTTKKDSVTEIAKQQVQFTFGLSPENKKIIIFH